MSLIGNRLDNVRNVDTFIVTIFRSVGRETIERKVSLQAKPFAGQSG